LLKENTNQLKQTFALRGSWLLETSKDTRLTTFTHLKKLYHHRSQIVHSGKTQKSKEAKNDIKSWQTIAENLFQEYLNKKCFGWKEKEWDQLILGIEP